jgi:hypothetical protein
MKWYQQSDKLSCWQKFNYWAEDIDWFATSLFWGLLVPLIIGAWSLLGFFLYSMFTGQLS